MNRSVITIAVGKPYYLRLAENLLKSFLLWNNGNEIHFLLVTDNMSFFNRYNDNTKVSIKLINISESDKSFTSKFKLFELATASDNLFIDCDCLIYKDLGYIFEAFKGRSFSAIGNDIVDGDFFCDVKKTLKYFNLIAMPKFVGSIYFFKKDDKARLVFETASALKNKYDELGFVRLRNKENEEPLFAVALRLENEKILPNTGVVKADLMYYRNVVSNVLNGSAFVSKPILDITGGEEIPNSAYPGILHFNATFSDNYIYKSESYRLRYIQYDKHLIETIVFLRFKLPFEIETGFKRLFRPFYHFFLGHRSIAQRGNELGQIDVLLKKQI